jgi:glutamate-1-semialdehyde 2,1-aminomutase
MVELAEAFTDRVEHADWAMFCKNGTDATTICVSIARAATGKRKVLVAEGAYHGSDPWCTPRLAGTTPEDRANFLTYRYNDLASVTAAAERAGDDLAAVLVSPIRHDLGIDLELPGRDFPAGLRALCDRLGAALILDDVRCGLRLNNGGSWEPLGVRPDLSAWSKAIANGYALGAVGGTSALVDAASAIYVTGSFWYGAVSMAASLATLRVLDEEDTVSRMVKIGSMLRDGLAAQARSHGVEVSLSGPVQMPFLMFGADRDFALADVFADHAIRNGVWLHPKHNWFVSGAMSEADVERVLDVTDHGFAAVAAAQ